MNENIDTDVSQSKNDSNTEFSEFSIDDFPETKDCNINNNDDIIHNEECDDQNIYLNHNKSKTNEKEIIKHIVISGGGQYGFYTYGFLKESNKNGMWKIENIQSIYGTSVGALIGATLCLKYDWDILDKYLIKRPWHNIFKIDINSIFNVIQNKGIFNISVFKEFFSPLFKGTNEDISIDITMKDFYDITKIEFHIFVTEINTFKITDISYKTHPEYSLIEAVYESCSIPIVFSPLIRENFCNIDGGLIVNYPIEYCLKNVENPRKLKKLVKCKEKY